MLLGHKETNLSAGAPPTVNDDITLGYTVGSRWIDITNDKEYVCLDNTNGAAVWLETTVAATPPFVMPDETLYHMLIKGNTIKGQYGGWAPGASAVAADGWGIYDNPTEVDNASTRTVEAGGIRFNQATSGVLNNEAYISTHPYLVHERQHLFAILIKFCLTETTDKRFFIMVHTTAPADLIDDEEPAAGGGAEYVGLSYDTGRGDANWVLRCGGGVNDVAWDSGVAVSTNDLFLRIEAFAPVFVVELLDSSMTRLCIKAFVSNIPAAASELYFTMITKTLAAAVKTHSMYYCHTANQV